MSNIEFEKSIALIPQRISMKQLNNTALPQIIEEEFDGPAGLLEEM
jgi:hypothetical protein